MQIQKFIFYCVNRKKKVLISHKLYGNVIFTVDNNNKLCNTGESIIFMLFNMVDEGT